jgi:putative heme-binding domain-containing protein
VLQCIRCHRVGDFPGGEAGPNLADIGARGTREYILESIIKPSAKIAPGFEVVTITKKSGEQVAGTVLERNAQSIRLKTGETETVTLPAADIAKVESAPSAMPELAALVLKKSEIRDLVELVDSFKKLPRHQTGKPEIRALQHLAGD